MMLLTGLATVFVISKLFYENKYFYIMNNNNNNSPEGLLSFLSLILILSISSLSEAKVLELSDRFIPLKTEGMWLIKFYAPWCGHCKKLEPIWKHVEQALTRDPVRVGRVDCTRFPAVSTEFEIHGFPTILFLKGDNQFVYEGDRTKDDLVAFAKRLMGPPITKIQSEAEFREVREKSEIIFVYSGEASGPLYENFKYLATNYQQHEFFYHISTDLLEKVTGIKEDEDSSIRVFKDGTSYKFEETDMLMPPKVLEVKSHDDAEPTPPTAINLPGNGSLFSWVNEERFPLFMKVTRGRFNSLLATKKLIVMAVLDENRIGELSSEMEEFRDMLRSVIDKNHDRYRKIFQFGWTGTPDLANSVAMETLPLPSLLVINVTSYQHHLPDDDPTKMTPEAIQLFLDNILEGSAPIYGGSSYTVRLYRAYYEATSNLNEMWKGNPALTAVLFGLPFGFFSLICYSICCADIMDAEDEDEDEDDVHEKTD